MSDQELQNLIAVVARMNEAITRLDQAFISLGVKINECEEKLEELRVEFDHHAHPHPAGTTSKPVKPRTDPSHPLIAKPGHQTGP